MISIRRGFVRSWSAPILKNGVQPGPPGSIFALKMSETRLSSGRSTGSSPPSDTDKPGFVGVAEVVEAEGWNACLRELLHKGVPDPLVEVGVVNRPLPHKNEALSRPSRDCISSAFPYCIHSAQGC